MGNPDIQRLNSGSGQYKQWAAQTPDIATNGAQIIFVNSKTGRAYYNYDHYYSFVEIELKGWG
ncbi:hypothetical protein QM201_04415 [Enterobacter asburiae]|nr:hypothetical protein [Enterobacter asburiae]